MFKPTLPNLRLRSQFSLRALMLLMAAVGIGFTVYRWPWQETTEFHYGRGLRLYTTSTYRRDWRGSKVKHGSETVATSSGQVEHCYRYEDGVVVLHRTFNIRGNLVEESSWDPQLQRTHSKRGDGKVWISRTDHTKDWKIDGIWERIIDRRDGQTSERSERWSTGRFHGGLELPTDPIRLVQHWQASEQHGRTIWETTEGELLNTAEYQHDNLVAWNGQPVVEQFRAWIGQKLPAGHEFHQFALMKEGWDSCDGPLLFCVQVKLKDVYPMDGPLLWFEDSPRHRLDGVLRCENQSVAAAVTEFAVQYGYCISYRYGVLWFTPQVDAGSVFGDRTGIDSVRFESGSAAEQEWTEPVITRYLHLKWPDILEHVVMETSIRLDLSAISVEGAETAEPPDDELRALCLARRDALGFWLYRLGLRCEQHGTTFKITRRWEPPVRESPIEQRPAPATSTVPVDPFGS